MFDESLKQAYENFDKRLEYIEHANEIRLRNDIEKHKETDNCIKQMKETIEIHHRETRKRLKKLENDTISGYLDGPAVFHSP